MIFIIYLQLSTFCYCFAILVLFTTLKTINIVMLFPVSVTNELCYLGILMVVLLTFAYMKVTKCWFFVSTFYNCWSWSWFILFMSGFGLIVECLKRKKLIFIKRVIKSFIPFWIAFNYYVLSQMLCLWIKLICRIYYKIYVRIFSQTADGFDVNSPFWYITLMIMFYLFYIHWYFLK